ncbi:MAG: hypothetical protein K8T20_14250 [Planctomycetes bacterium]|nr:hypothetical protein [Planctomycetota bacterium]
MPRLLPACVLLLSAAFAVAEDAPTLEIHPGVKAGAKTTRTMETHGKGTLSVDTGAGPKEFECELEGVEEAAEEVLEAKEGRAQKCKRLYRRKESVFKVPSLSKEDEKQSSLVGRLLTLERKDGKSVATCAEKNVNPSELHSETLDDEWDIPLATATPVALHESWKPDARSVQSWAGARGRKIDSATLDCTWAEQTTTAGRNCARIEISFAAKGTMKAGDKQPEQKVEWTLDGDVWWSLDDARVVKFDLKGDLKLEWDVEAKGEHWVTKNKIRLVGTSTPGEAKFEEK